MKYVNSAEKCANGALSRCAIARVIAGIRSALSAGCPAAVCSLSTSTNRLMCVPFWLAGSDTYMLIVATVVCSPTFPSIVCVAGTCRRIGYVTCLTPTLSIATLRMSCLPCTSGMSETFVAIVSMIGKGQGCFLARLRDAVDARGECDGAERRGTFCGVRPKAPHLLPHRGRRCQAKRPASEGG